MFISELLPYLKYRMLFYTHPIPTLEVLMYLLIPKLVSNKTRMHTFPDIKMTPFSMYYAANINFN